ncbi:MAG: hypothetical protein D6719_13710 [Candidatus Dadabacteria bacterium]|nr:MAG: hypothetical protein D6719_13710 [Candidatus Dadabacteria bacterium]
MATSVETKPATPELSQNPTPEAAQATRQTLSEGSIAPGRIDPFTFELAARAHERANGADIFPSILPEGVVPAERAPEISAPAKASSPEKHRGFWGALKKRASNLLKAGELVGKSVLSAAAKTLETTKQIGRSVVKGIGKGISFLTNPETYQKISSAISDVIGFIKDPETREAIRKAWNKAKELAAELHLEEKLKNGLAALKKKETWKKMGKALLSAAGNGLKAVWETVKDPKILWGTVKSAGHFAWDMIKSLGIKDFVGGLWQSVKATGLAFKGGLHTAATLLHDIGAVAAGKMTPEELHKRFIANVNNVTSSVKESLKSAARSFKGAAILLGEVTGIIDVVYATRYAIQGNWGMAAMHAGFAVASIGSIAATVATAGVAASSIAAVATGKMAARQAAKKVLSTIAKKAFKGLAKEMGEQAVKELESTVGKEMIEKTLKEGAEEIADRGVKDLAEEITKRGAKALSKDAMETTMRNSAETVTERIMRELGLDKIVDRLTTRMLRELSEANGKEVAERLLKLGIASDKKAARRMARAMRETLKHSAYDPEIKKILEDAITKNVKEYLEKAMEKPFKKRLRASLTGELGDESSKIVAKTLREQAERLGRNLDELIDEYVEAGWKGAREGIKRGVRKVVREGIERAFKRFRAIKKRPIIPPHRAGKHGSGGTVEVSDFEPEVLDITEVREAGLFEKHLAHKDALELNRFRVDQVVINGETYVRLFEQEDSKWVLVAMTRLEDSTALPSKAA